MNPSACSDWTPWAPPGRRVRTLVGPGSRRFDLMLYAPEGEPPKNGWPCLVVLDGERFFDIFAGAASILARRREKTGVAPMVVLALAHRADQGAVEDQRALDFTTFPCAQIDGARPGGGADAFRRFLDEAVLPEATASVAIDRTRLTLFGHSLAGLFVLETLETRPDLFARWASISPSLWWRTPDAVNGSPDLMVGCGELETGRDMRARIEAWTAARRVAGAEFRLAPRADHGAAPVVLVPDILRHASCGHSRGSALTTT